MILIRGHSLDPASVLLNSGELVVKIVAECVAGAINDTLPGWRWRPVDLQTGQAEGDLMAWNTTIPACSEWEVCYMLCLCSLTWLLKGFVTSCIAQNFIVTRRSLMFN